MRETSFRSTTNSIENAVGIHVGGDSMIKNPLLSFNYRLMPTYGIS